LSIKYNPGPGTAQTGYYPSCYSALLGVSLERPIAEPGDLISWVE
jgi:hypothetical protein